MTKHVTSSSVFFLITLKVDQIIEPFPNLLVVMCMILVDLLILVIWRRCCAFGAVTHFRANGLLGDHVNAVFESLILLGRFPGCLLSFA